MSARLRSFVIRPDPPDAAVTHEQLQALACQLGLADTDGVQATIAGKELRITLTPLGIQALKEADL